MEHKLYKSSITIVYIYNLHSIAQLYFNKKLSKNIITNVVYIEIINEMFYILGFIVFRIQCVFYQHSTLQYRLVTCPGLRSHKH